MTYFSLFSGIGGFEEGIRQAYEDTKNRPQNSPDDSGATSQYSGHPLCVGFSEIDKYAIQIYSKHFPSHKNFGNIRDIIAEELPDFGLLCGGFPCQSFSIAGKRGGFEDTRGTLFFDIARIAKIKRPRLLFLENVKGLLSHDGGRTFNTIIGTLDELGYDLQWEVLNSKNFGVPQNRERVFIIGHLRGTPRPKVFPYEPEYFEDDSRPDESGAGVRQISGTLKARDYGNWNGTYIKQMNDPKHSNNRVYAESGISPSLNTMQGGNRQPKISVDMKIRRLTPVECERLQGFEDGWTEGISDSQRYKCLGNAVTVNVIKAIAKKLSPAPIDVIRQGTIL